MLLHLRLDNVGAYNLDVDVGDKRFSTIITLKQVPSFLIEAFTRLSECDAWNVEGIFRKEGNVNRIKNVMSVYFGTVPIPREYMIHDICTLIKRFFREIRVPIFIDKQRTLLKYAENLADNNSATVNLILETINKGLPACHVGTLGYLMRLLKEISENCH
uniref:Rho-GAP domain-containing protein n=1 Tax=Acrobeloides nanus TaxID=290746 RepID=A0A914DDA9_9BILA